VPTRASIIAKKVAAVGAAFPIEVNGAMMLPRDITDIMTENKTLDSCQ
jgi:hypothetical protein